MIADVRLLAAAAWRLSRRGVAGAVTALLFNGLLSGASLLLLIPIVNSISDNSVAVTVPLFGDLRLSEVPLVVLLSAFVLLIAVQAAVAQASAVSTSRVQYVLIDRLRFEAFAAVLHARWTFVLTQRRSDIVAVVTLGAVRAGMAYSQLLQFCVAGVITLVTAVVALLVSTVVAAIAIAGVVVISIAQSLAVRPAHRLGVELGHRQRAMQAVVADSLDSLRLVRAHGASSVWTERLADAFAETRQVQLANTRRQTAVAGLTSIGTAIGASALVLIAVALDVPPATIAIVLLLVFRIAISARQMVNASAAMANSLPAVRDLVELTDAARLDEEVPAGDASPESTRDRVNDATGDLVELQNASYTYPDSVNGVHDVSLRLPRGTVTALVGPSGAGKSTIVDLTLGLLTPQSGSVLIGSAPLQPSELLKWRAAIGYVPQETMLIPGTLRDNLVWSVTGDTDDEQCWLALDRSAAAFARNLPAGLDTVLGERGLRLSGGERQRIALARALLRRPSLLILDEPTSSLDEETEQAVLDLLRSLTPAMTVLIVAHRRSTIDAADRIIRLDAGRVVT